METGTTRYVPTAVPVLMFPGKFMGHVLNRETGQLAAESMKVRKTFEAAFADAEDACVAMQKTWDAR